MMIVKGIFFGRRIKKFFFLLFFSRSFLKREEGGGGGGKKIAQGYHYPTSHHLPACRATYRGYIANVNSGEIAVSFNTHSP